jgi:hypothetical protein
MYECETNEVNPSINQACFHYHVEEKENEQI